MARTIKRHAGVDYIADEDFDYTTAIREAEDAGCRAVGCGTHDTAGHKSVNINASRIKLVARLGIPG